MWTGLGRGGGGKYWCDEFRWLQLMGVSVRAQIKGGVTTMGDWRQGLPRRAPCRPLLRFRLGILTTCVQICRERLARGGSLRGTQPRTICHLVLPASFASGTE